MTLDSSHIGRLHERRPLLERSEFEKYEKLAISENLDGEERQAAIREALVQLSLRLNHQLVREGGLKLPDEGPGRLTTFWGPRRQQGETYYALVTGAGRLAVGRAALSEKPDFHTLEDFDPRTQEVVSLAVSRRHRFIGSRLDLWVLVRSMNTDSEQAEDVGDATGSSDEAVIAYHGLISFQKESIHVEPARDDWEDGVARWRAAPVHGLPDPLMRLHLTCSPGVDPCRPISKEKIKQLENSSGLSSLGPEYLARSRNYLATYTEQGIRLLATSSRGQARLLPRQLEEPFSFLCLQEAPDPDAPELEGKGKAPQVHGVAGSDAQRLLGFTWAPFSSHGEEADKPDIWTQTLPRYPADVAFVPRSKVEWPDLLVLYRNGNFERLSFLGRPRLYALWTELWRQLCGDDDLCCRLKAARAAIPQSTQADVDHFGGAEEDWRGAALFAATERVLRAVRDEGESQSTEQRAAWVEQLVDLFDTSMNTVHLRQSLSLVLRHFVKSIQEPGAYPAGECCRDLSIRVLYGVYDKLQFSHIELLAQIDRVVRSMSDRVSDTSKCDHLEALLRRSHRNRPYIWSQRDSEGEKELFARKTHPELRWQIYMANFGLERWASAFLPADSLRLWLPAEENKEKDAPPVTDLCAWRVAEGRETLAVARGNQLWLADLDSNAQMKSWQQHDLWQGPELESDASHLLRLLSLGEGTLVAADSRGRLHLVRSDGGKPVPKHTDGTLPDGSTVWALNQLAGAEPPVFVVGARQRWRSALFFFRLDEQGLEHLETRSLDLAEASCLQTSQHAQNKWNLLTVSAQSGRGQLQVVDLSPRLLPIEEREFELSQEGLLTASFDDEQNPSCLVVGDRAGMLWCIDLEHEGESVTDWLRWTYKLDSAIRSVRPFRAFDEPCFLAGSERGKLVLLRARDGRRLWKHSQRSPVRLVRPIQIPIEDEKGDTETADGLAVGMRDSWISVFIQTTEDDKETQKVTEGWLQQINLAPEDHLETLWPELGAEAVRVVAEISQNPTELGNLLRERPLNRTERARVLRYLARQWQPNSELDLEILHALEASLPWLSLRDLSLLLHYADPPESTQLVGLVRQGLHQKRPKAQTNPKKRGDNSPNALMAAVVATLQRMPTENQTLEFLYSWPPLLDLVRRKNRWVRVELAKRILERLREELPKAQGAGLLGPAFPVLQRLPPSLVSGCVWASKPGSPLRAAFEHLERWQRELAQARPTHAEDWLQLAKLLEDLPDSSSEKELDGGADANPSAARLLQPLLELGGTYLQATQTGQGSASSSGAVKSVGSEIQLFDEDGLPASWEELRAETLDMLRRLSRACRHVTQADLPGPLLPHLQALLPSRPLPGEDETQEERIAWWRQLEDRLQGRKQSAGTESEDKAPVPWQPVFEALASWMQNLLAQVQRWEIHYLLNEARVRLVLHHLQAVEVDDLGRVEVPLQIEPESRRQLQQVEVQITAHLQGPPNDRQRSLTFDSLPASPRRETLRGTAKSGQKELRVRAKLNSAEGEHARTWTFPLTWPTTSDDLDVPLEFVHDPLRRQLNAETSSVRWVVLDRALGRRAWGRAWLEQHPWRRIDLDGLLEDTGQGRRYEHRSLGLEVIREAILTNTVKARAARDLTDETFDLPPLLVAPMDQTLQRLLDGETPGQLEAVMSWLEQRHSDNRKPHLTFVISATQAARLRAFTELPMLPMHQLLHDPVDHTALQRVALEQATAWLASSAGVPEETAAAVLERFGGDLALAAAWRRWWSNRDRSTSRLQDAELRIFLQGSAVGERLQAEFIGLNYWQRLYAVVGALATTNHPVKRLQPGLVAGETYYSTLQKGQRGKKIQEAGDAFTVRSQQALLSGTHAPAQVEVEGLAVRGSHRVPAGTTLLLPLVLAAGPGRRKRTSEELAQLGLGTWQHGVFRTRTPYREWVHDLYEQQAETPDADRDRAVFEQLLGPGTSPLQGLEPSDVLELGDNLQHLYRGASGAQRIALQLLAEVWLSQEPETVTEKVTKGLRQLFDKERVGVLPSDGTSQTGSQAWDAALRQLTPVAFGIGSIRHHPNWDSSPRHYWLWLPAGSTIDLDQVVAAIKHSQEQQIKALRAEQEAARENEISPDQSQDLTDNSSQEAAWHPSIAMFGPGATTWQGDAERRLAILRFSDLLHLAWNGQLNSAGLISFLRSQLRLTAMSPFSTRGSLEAGSPLFRGRDDELDFLRRHARRKSILIVGARRVGKTSLLNQVYGWAKDQPELLPIFVDLQYKETLEAYRVALASAVELEQNRPGTEALKPLAGKPREEVSVESIAEACRAAGRLPLFLFNEIDGLARQDELVGTWRALSDAKRAQFVLVGYGTVAQLGRTESPWFNFTIGSDLDGQAIVLTALSPSAARSLLALLTEEPLSLRWASEEEREQGEQLLLERSHRIPWVLQRFAQLLVERLEKQRRHELRLTDVQHVATARGGVVWSYFQELEWDQLGFDGRQDKEPTRRPGYQLLLYAVVRQRYFLGNDPLIQDERLAERSPLKKGLGFTLNEAQEMFLETIQELLFPEECEQVMRWLRTINLQQALRLLTLTLALEPDPDQAHRYGFLQHILPLELHHQFGAEDPTLDTLIIDTAADLLRLMELKATSEELSNHKLGRAEDPE